jgi:hypothetical protein
MFVMSKLWRILKGPLRAALKDKFSLIKGQLKGLLSTTINDLVDSLQSTYFATDVWKHEAKAEILSTKDSKQLLRVSFFPLSAIVTSSQIQAELIKHLGSNVPLEAARTTAQISDNDWKVILNNYAADILRHGLPIALQRMVDDEKALYLSHYVIDLPKKEPIIIKSTAGQTAGYHDLVVLYERSTYGDAPSVSKAKKTWGKRNSGGHSYKRDSYDGYVAP